VGKEDCSRQDAKTPRSNGAFYLKLNRHGRVARQRVPATQSLLSVSHTRLNLEMPGEGARRQSFVQFLGGRYALPRDAAMTNDLDGNAPCPGFLINASRGGAGVKEDFSRKDAK
jgi:hypothetical protein